MRKALEIIGIGIAVSLLIALFTGHWAITSNENNMKSDSVIISTDNRGSSPQTIVVVRNDLGTVQSGETRGIPPFEKLGGKIITKEELNSFLKTQGLSIYIPKWVPEGLKLVAIWADTSRGVGFPIILVYSSDDNDTDYRVSESKLVVEIRGKVSRSIMNKTLLEYYISRGAIPITENGELVGLIFEDAYCPTCSSQKTLPLAIVKIGDLEYWINYDDVDSIIKLIKSMAQTSAIT